jgi:hypothetical protein
MSMPILRHTLSLKNELLVRHHGCYIIFMSWILFGDV